MREIHNEYNNIQEGREKDPILYNILFWQDKQRELEVE